MLQNWNCHDLDLFKVGGLFFFYGLYHPYGSKYLLKMDVWNTRFLLGPGLFSGAMLVSWSVTTLGIQSPNLRMVSWKLNDLCVSEVMKDTPCSSFDKVSQDP